MKTNPIDNGPAYESLILPGVPTKPFPSASRHSYVSGNPNSQALRVRYFMKDDTQQLVGRAWFGPETEGPPGYAHGGSQAALLDEGMGAVAWHSGQTVVAAKIEINFRRPLPLGTLITVWTEITKIEGRKVYTSARLQGDDGIIYSESSGLFVVIDLNWPPTMLASDKK